MMSSAVFNDAYQALNLDQPENQQIPKNDKVGRLNNRIATFIVLGGASVLAASAAVVATIFASYIVAAFCAAAFLTITLSAIIVSQITHSPVLIDLIKRMTQKIKDLFNEIKELRDQKPAPALEPENQNLLSQIEELKRELETKNREIAQIQAPQNQHPHSNEEIEKQKIKIDESKKTEDENNTKEKGDAQKLLPQNDELLNNEEKKQKDKAPLIEPEFTGLKSEPVQVNSLIKELPLEKSDKDTSPENVDQEFDIRLLALQSPKDPDAFFPMDENLPEVKNPEKVEPAPKKEKKSTPKKTIKRTTRTNLEDVKLKTKLEKFENVESIEKLNLFEIDETTKEQINRNFLELIDTETNYVNNLKKLIPYFKKLMYAELIDENQYNSFVKMWDALIEQGEILRNSLAILKDPVADIVEKIKAYHQAFWPKNIKTYMHVHLEVIRNELHIKLLEKSNLAKEIIENFRKIETNNDQDPSSFSILPVQRIPRIKDLMLVIQKNTKGIDQNVKKALEHNYTYLSTYLLLINTSTPKI